MGLDRVTALALLERLVGDGDLVRLPDGRLMRAPAARLMPELGQRAAQPPP